MRQRNIKNLDERIQENSRFLVEDPRSCKGHWNEVFGNDNPVFLEIGCGKGRFIEAHAQREPSCNFIACEGQASVVLRALEKAEEKNLENLRIFIDYVHDLQDYFEEGEIAGVYLNFSDPWPKARHAKRRLTYHKNLENYRSVLSENGFIEFKTDNEELFEFTLEEIGTASYTITEMTRNLHGETNLGPCAAKSAEYMTEYEEKFSTKGKNINYVRI